MPTPLSPQTRKTPTPEPGNPNDLASHHHLVSKILEKTGFEAREFQINAAKAVLGGQDVVVHAGTGSGKTLIFAAPHFVSEKKTSIVISPLILLQHDQASEERMQKMGLTAIALNKEVHVETETWVELAQGKYEIVLLSPEMALHSEDVHRVFDSDAFRKALMAIHVDEAHTISLWGGDFRKDYQGLGRIRARLPKGVPATLVSATLRPNVKHDAMSTLGFSSDPSKYVDINVGNERFNVYIGARPMQYSSLSFKDVLLHFDPDEIDPKNIPQTIIYIDNVNEVTSAVVALYGWLHPSLSGQELIMPVHAWMTPKYRSEAMAKFASGEVRVIIATEAAGMGCDISNIKRVIQFGVCGSIDAFMQRIGRVWRGLDGKGEGWLIYEKWVPNCNSEKTPKEKGKAPVNKKRKAGGEAGPTLNASTSKAGAKTERKCDLLIQKFVTESKCRREYLNRVYNNPRSGVTVPAQDCCDLCNPNSAIRIPSRQFPAQRGPPRAARVSGEPNPNMLSCLRTWRTSAFRGAFGVSRMFGSSALISDAELERISRCAPVPSIDRLRSYLVKWPHVNSQLESMWEALKAGGFALSIESSELTPSESPLAPRSQPTPGPSTLPATSGASKPRDSTGAASKARPRATKRPTSTQTPAVDDKWWRGYSGERNYEVRRSNMDDFRRIFAEQAEQQPDETPPQHTQRSKRRRMNDAPTPRSAHLELSLGSHSTAGFHSAPHITNSTFSAPARPVGRLIVPSQRLAAPLLEQNRASRTVKLDRSLVGNAPIPLVHPLPILPPNFTCFGVSRRRDSPSSTLAPHRPSHPKPYLCYPFHDQHRMLDDLRALLSCPADRPCLFIS